MKSTQILEKASQHMTQLLKAEKELTKEALRKFQYATFARVNGRCVILYGFAEEFAVVRYYGSDHKFMVKIVDLKPF